MDDSEVSGQLVESFMLKSAPLKDLIVPMLKLSLNFMADDLFKVMGSMRAGGILFKGNGSRFVLPGAPVAGS